MIDFAGLSEIGPIRADNQDAFYIPDDTCPPGVGPICALADGMGGLAQGGIASTLALKTLLDTYFYYLYIKPAGALKRGIEAANLAVRTEADHLGVTHMGTTLIAAAITGSTLHIAHIGDSRAYLLRKGKVTCLTQDHTLVGDLLRMKIIKSWQVRTHTQRSILTRAVGMSLFIQPDIFSLNLLPGDRLVLCTDGCWAVIEDDEVAYLANRASGPAELCRALVDTAIAHGSDDNISVVAAYVRQIPSLPRSGAAVGGWMEKLFGN